MKVDPNGCLVMSSEEIVDISKFVYADVVKDSKYAPYIILIAEPMCAYLLMIDVLPVAGSPKTRTFASKINITKPIVSLKSRSGRISLP